MNGPANMGHEYCGVVVEVGEAVKTIKPGQFVVGSFCLSDNTCPHCRFGFQSSCEQREFMTGAQAPYARVPLADGTLVATPHMPDDDLIRACWPSRTFSAPAGMLPMQPGFGRVDCRRRRRWRRRPDGRSCRQADGGERIIAMSRHKSRQDLALEFGATHIVSERGDDGVKRIKEITDGIGAESVLECVGTQESMSQAISCARPGGHIGFVGVPHGVQIAGQDLFFAQKSLMGGPAPSAASYPISWIWCSNGRSIRVVSSTSRFRFRSRRRLPCHGRTTGNQDAAAALTHTAQPSADSIRIDDRRPPQESLPVARRPVASNRDISDMFIIPKRCSRVMIRRSYWASPWKLHERSPVRWPSLSTFAGALFAPSDRMS